MQSFEVMCAPPQDSWLSPVCCRCIDVLSTIFHIIALLPSPYPAFLTVAAAAAAAAAGELTV
jgi:hypothetical protein